MATPARVRSILAAAVVVLGWVSSATAAPIASLSPDFDTGLTSVMPAAGVFPS